MSDREIIEIKKKNRQLVSEYRKKLQTKLENLCKNKTGHSFYDWRDASYINCCGIINEVFERSCCSCGYREHIYREDISKEIKVPDAIEAIKEAFSKKEHYGLNFYLGFLEKGDIFIIRDGSNKIICQVNQVRDGVIEIREVI